jgi:hypothetical protein
MAKRDNMDEIHVSFYPNEVWEGTSYGVKKSLTAEVVADFTLVDPDAYWNGTSDMFLERIPAHKAMVLFSALKVEQDDLKMVLRRLELEDKAKWL